MSRFYLRRTPVIEVGVEQTLVCAGAGSLLEAIDAAPFEGQLDVSLGGDHIGEVDLRAWVFEGGDVRKPTVFELTLSETAEGGARDSVIFLTKESQIHPNQPGFVRGETLFFIGEETVGSGTVLNAGRLNLSAEVTRVEINPDKPKVFAALVLGIVVLCDVGEFDPFRSPA